MSERLAWFIFTNFNLSKFPNFISEWVYKRVGF
jgi:hypothetical protein